MDLEYYYVIIKPTRDDFITNPKKEDNEIMSDHFTYLKKLLADDKLLLAGPTLIETDPFGVIIVKTESEKKARDLVENDPSVKTGIQKIIDFRRFRPSLMGKK